MGSWVDKAVAKGTDYLNRKCSDADMKAAGLAALKVVEKRKVDIEKTTESAFKTFVGALARGDAKDAEIAFIREKATAKDLIEGMEKDATDLMDKRHSIDALKATALSLAKDITFAGARYLLPLLT